MLRGVDQPVIAVRDLDAAVERYAALLGMPACWRGVHPGAGTAHALFRVANSGLELLSPDVEGPLGRQLAQVLERSGEGLVALAFATDAADACAEALRRRGIAASEPRPGESRDAAGAARRWRSVEIPPGASRGIPLFAVERADASAPAASAPPSGVEALDHVVITSSALDVARRFYADDLGLRLALDRRFEARGLRILFFRIGGVTVEVVGPLEPPQSPDPVDGFGGLAWRVADLDAARERLVRRFDVSAVRAGAKPGTRVFTVRADTCGVPTLVIGR